MINYQFDIGDCVYFRENNLPRFGRIVYRVANLDTNNYLVEAQGETFSRAEDDLKLA